MYRFEKKYVLNQNLKYEFLNIIKSYPLNSKSLFPPRIVNNVYFDTLLLENFYSNIFGECNRKKYRLRWYGDQGKIINNSNLEIKIKKNNIGSKIIFPIKNINVQNLKKLKPEITKLNLPDEIKIPMKFLTPTLSNSYFRYYFKSFNNEIRITFDEKLTYKSYLNNFEKKFKENKIFILEIKYNIEYSKIVSDLTKRLPLRPTKFSKYTNGLLNTNAHLIE